MKFSAFIIIAIIFFFLHLVGAQQQQSTPEMRRRQDEVHPGHITGDHDMERRQQSLPDIDPRIGR